MFRASNYIRNGQGQAVYEYNMTVELLDTLQYDVLSGRPRPETKFLGDVFVFLEPSGGVDWNAASSHIHAEFIDGLGSQAR